LTREAVKDWQDDNGVEYGDYWGYFGPSSQAVYDSTCGTDVPPVDPPVTETKVSLAANTPAATTLVTSASHGSQALVPMVEFVFSNGTANNVKVTTLNLTRTGIAADADLANVYLYDGNTRLAEVTSVANRVYSFVDAGGLFSIPANSTKNVLVSADLANDAISGKTIALGIADVTHIVADGITFSGNFPINGNIMSMASVTDIGRLTVGTTVTAPASVDPGATDREVIRFDMVAENQNLSVDYIKFTNVGTIANTDLINLKLMDGATQLGNTLTSLSADNTAVFDLSANPLAITSGTTKSLTVTADIIGGSGRNFKLTIQRQSDIMVEDTNYGINVKPFTDSSNEIFTVIQPAAATNVNVGTLAINVDSASPSGNVALDSTNVELARFHFVAYGEAVRVLSLPVTISVTGGKNLRNVRLLLDGSQIGATQNISGTSATSFTFPASGDFGNSFIIPAGTTGKTLSIRADIKELDGTAIADTNTIVASLGAGSANAQGQITYTTIGTAAATGRTLTVATGALSAAKNLTVPDGSVTIPNAVKGATGEVIGSFVLTAGAGEAVNVSQIQLKDIVDNATVAATTHDAITDGTGRSITVGELAPFVVGETYYVELTATPATNYATIVVTAKTAASGLGALTATVSGTEGTMGEDAGITIRSAAGATDTLADTFQNLKLMMGTTQIGTTISSLTDTAATTYTFTPSNVISISAGQQAVFNVLADVKTGATTLSVNSDSDGIVALSGVTALGALTNTDAGITADTKLQNVYFAGTGSLAATVHPDTPIVQQLVLGDADANFAQFRLSEGSLGEHVNVSQIIIRATVSSEKHGVVNNVRLMAGETLLGTVASLAHIDATTGEATFSGLNLTVPKGSRANLTVKADITPFPGGTSNTDVTFDLHGFTATGDSSGSSIATDDSGNASQMKVYATKISAELDATSPVGLTGKSLDKEAAIFNVYNSSNAGDFDAILRDLAVNVSLSGTWGTTGDRHIRVYKNSVISANKLAEATFAGGDQLDNVAFENWDTSAAMTNVEIASGASVKLIVTVDTAQAPEDGTLTISIPATNGMKWFDGFTEITTVDDLPLTGGTLKF